MKRILTILFLSILIFCSCKIKMLKPENYLYSDKHHLVKIINDSDIVIQKINGIVISECKGKYKKISRNKILVNCYDIRGDSIYKYSFINVIPPEFKLEKKAIKLRLKN